MFDRIQHLNEIRQNCNPINDMDWNCIICGACFDRPNSLANHLILHNLSSKEYYDKYLLKGNNKCYCGKEAVYLGLNKGYGKLCSLNCPEGVKTVKFSNVVKEAKKGIKAKLVIYTDEYREKVSKRTKLLWKNGEMNFENKGGRCKWFDIDGVLLQGRYELYYYLLNNKEPIKCKHNIKTPYGWYRPDFEYNDIFIEIKSKYTIKTSVKNGQMKKIKWVSNNIKKVSIVILDESTVADYLKNSQYE